MFEYLLDRDLFLKAARGGKAGDGDYVWEYEDSFDDEDRKRVYRRDHVPTGNVTFWVCQACEDFQATMRQVVKVPVLTHEWRLA